MAIGVSKERILLISHSQKLGGAEKCLIELAQSLKDLGYDIIVVVPSKGDNYDCFVQASNFVIIKSFPWWLISSSNSSIYVLIRRFFSHLKAIFSFVSIIRNSNPSLVISNTIDMPSGIIASKFLGVKNVFVIHEFGDIDHNYKFEFSKAFSFSIIRIFADKIVVNSDFLLQYYQEKLKRNDLIVWNYSVDIPESNNVVIDYSSEATFNLFLIGQIQPGKGQLDAIMAMDLLLKNHINVELFIIGQISDTNYYDELLNHISRLDIKNIHFKAHRPNPFSYIEKNAIGLICSRNEAFGRITIELMKLGIPVIALDKPNNSNLIENEVNGLLYKYNDIDDLAAKILLLIANRKLRDEIIENALVYSGTKFNTKGSVGTFVDIIDNKELCK